MANAAKACPLSAAARGFYQWKPPSVMIDWHTQSAARSKGCLTVLLFDSGGCLGGVAGSLTRIKLQQTRELDLLSAWWTKQDRRKVLDIWSVRMGRSETNRVGASMLHVSSASKLLPNQTTKVKFSNRKGILKWAPYARLQSFMIQLLFTEVESRACACRPVDFSPKQS